MARKAVLAKEYGNQKVLKEGDPVQAKPVIRKPTIGDLN